MKKLWIVLVLFSISALADEVEAPSPSKLSHESEAGIVVTSGNSDTQTYALKQWTKYDWEQNTAKLSASYLLGKTNGVETAKKWDAGLRYDRLISGNFGAYLGYQLDGNTFAGLLLRHTVDLGGQYTILKTDQSTFRGELGYRLTQEKFTDDAKLTSHFARSYLEWDQVWNATVSSKLWVEYLRSFNNSADYRFNVEPSLSVILTNVISVKLAYLVNYRSVPAIAGKRYLDTIYTTSLVAKF